MGNGRVIRRHLSPSSRPSVVLLPPVNTPVETTASEPSEPTRVQVTSVAAGSAYALVYGRAQVTAPPIILGESSGAIICAYELCLGPIEQIVSYTFNGHALPLTGVSAQTFLGNNNGSVSSLLNTLIAGYAHKHPWLAYIVAKFEPVSDFFGGLPTVVAEVKGRNDVWDPRLDGGSGDTAWTENPALCAAHFVMDEVGANRGAAAIDWTSVTAAATYCDYDPSGSDTRYRLGLVLNQRRTNRENLNAIMQCARLGECYEGGLWKLVCDGDGTAPVMTLDKGSLLRDRRGRLLARMRHAPVEERPTRITSVYLDRSRSYEQIPQATHAPGVVAGSMPLRERMASSSGITSAAVDARLQMSNLLVGMHSRRLSLAAKLSALPLERCDLVWVKDICGLVHNAVVFNGTTTTITCTNAADFDIVDAGSFDIDFTCLGATAAIDQALLQKYHAEAGHYWGYGARISNANGRLYIAVGDATLDGVGPGDLRDGRLHRLRVSWAKNGRLMAWLDGDEIGNTAGGSASADETDAALLIGSAGFNGRISLVRIWSTCRTDYEHWRDRRRVFAAPYPDGLIGDFDFAAGSGSALKDKVSGAVKANLANHTWTTEGEIFRVVSAKPRPSLLGVDLELREYSPNSCATSTVTSTSTIRVDRVSTRSAPALPNATAAPPAPTGLSLTVQEDTVNGGKRYKILAEWTKASSGFVRGYRLTVIAGSTTRTILDGSRLATSAVIDVLEPNVSHSVYVYAVGSNGDLSAALSGSVTPGAVSVSISGSGSFGTKMRAPLQERKNVSATHYSGWWITLSWSASGSTSEIREFRIFRNGKQVATADADKTSIQLLSHHEVKDNSQGNSADQVICACSTSDTFRVDAVLKDGRTVSSGTLSVSGSGSDLNEYQTFANSAEDLVCMHDSFAGTVMPAVGSAPAKADRIWRDTSDWVWKKDESGRGYPSTPSGGNYYVDVTFPTAFPSGVTPRITLGPREPYLYWHTNESNTGFRLWSTNGTGGCDWRATAPLE